MKKIFSIFLIFLLSTPCSFAERMPKVKADKYKQMQEHYFDTNDTSRVMGAVIAALQDSDFVINDYDSDLGFVYAQKTFKGHYVNKKRVAGWSAMFALATAYTVFSYGATAASMYSPSRRVAAEMKDKNMVVDANIFVELMPNGTTKVRFFPVEKILQNADGFSFMKSSPMRVIRVYRPEIYQEFFAQVNENLNGGI